MNLSNFQTKMIEKARKRGHLWENFGQTELRKLEDSLTAKGYNKWSRDPKNVKIYERLRELDRWCMKVTDRDIR